MYRYIGAYLAVAVDDWLTDCFFSANQVPARNDVNKIPFLSCVLWFEWVLLDFTWFPWVWSVFFYRGLKDFYRFFTGFIGCCCGLPGFTVL